MTTLELKSCDTVITNYENCKLEQKPNCKITESDYNECKLSKKKEEKKIQEVAEKARLDAENAGFFYNKSGGKRRKSRKNKKNKKSRKGKSRKNRSK